MSNTIIWDVSPMLFKKSFLTLRWYNLLFGTAVLSGIPIFHYMLAKAGKDSRIAEKLPSYIGLAVLFGARLGHVIFYEWDYYRHHLLEIYLPVTFSPKFSITGFQGLASHGAAIGIILVVFLYVKQVTLSICPLRIHIKNRYASLTFLWLADHLAILGALGCAIIRIGNFMNSEIIGRPTGSNYGVLFVRELHEDLCKKYDATIQDLVIRKPPTTEKPPMNKWAQKANYPSIQLAITFKKTISDENLIKNFLQTDLKNELIQMTLKAPQHIYHPYFSPLFYTLEKQNGSYQASVYTWGIPRHPAQIYEACSYLLLFIMLFAWWHKKGQTLAPGRLFGSFAVIAFSLRFFYEFYKENQVAFENNMLLNMGQWLSLPWIIIGLFFILRQPTQRAPLKNIN